MRAAAMPGRDWRRSPLRNPPSFPSRPTSCWCRWCSRTASVPIHLAAWCTLFSVLGGALGYMIGSVFFDTVGVWLIHTYGLQSAFDGFRVAYAKYGYWIMVQGLTPIPYKLVTIASGFAGFNFPLFMTLSTVTRGLRYTLVSSLLYFFGAPVQAIIEKYMEFALIGFLVLVVLGFVAVRYIF